MSVEIKEEPRYSSSPEPEPDYEDLSPDSRVKRREQLDRDFDALKNKRKAIKDIDNADPMTRTLLVVGLYKNMPPKLSDFVASFEHLRNRRGRYEGVGMPSFSGFKVLHEKNYKFQDGKWTEVDECFLRTRGVKEARFLLDLGRFDLSVRESFGTSGFSVRFVPATQDDETRQKFRTVGALVERLAVVKKELSTIELANQVFDGRPMLAQKYVDKSVYKNSLEDWKRKRSAGVPLSSMDSHMLMSCIPVALEELTARLNKLWDEQWDIMIELREFQANGLDFTF